MTDKRCYKCETTKSTDQFYISKNMKDGLQPACKACVKQSSRERYAAIKANPERSQKDEARRRATRAGRYIEYSVKWCDAHPEEFREGVKQWVGANKPKLREFIRMQLMQEGKANGQ